jgi:hypothetical protein
MNDEELARALGRIEQKVDDHGLALERVETKVDHTNGRVRGLELFKARVYAVGAVVILLLPVYLPHLL